MGQPAVPSGKWTMKGLIPMTCLENGRFSHQLGPKSCINWFFSSYENIVIDLSYYSGLSNNTMFSLRDFEAQYIVLFLSVYIGITRLDDNFLRPSIHLLNENWQGNQGNQLPSDEMEMRLWLHGTDNIFQNLPILPSTKNKEATPSHPPLLSKKSNKTHLATNSWFFLQILHSKYKKKRSLTANAPPKMLGVGRRGRSAFPIGWNGNFSVAKCSKALDIARSAPVLGWGGGGWVWGEAPRWSRMKHEIWKHGKIYITRRFVRFSDDDMRYLG